MIVSVCIFIMNWLKFGYSSVPYLASILISVAVGILAFRRWIAPGIIEALEEATKTAQTLASLGGIKKENWHDEQALETVITKELLMDKMPELELLRLALSPASWEQVEEIIESNPAAALKIYEKYAPLLGVTSQKKVEYTF
ncbi:unnamed protein product [marine sediment metagenome]|uniref:Uncharacterized protein n=1 Tax=marine sediment metagenome TaxID=412755 RepID=X1P1X1_9ZZZZ